MPMNKPINEKLYKIVESKNLDETVICKILSQIIVKIDIITIKNKDYQIRNLNSMNF